MSLSILEGFQGVSESVKAFEDQPSELLHFWRDSPKEVDFWDVFQLKSANKGIGGKHWLWLHGQRVK